MLTDPQTVTINAVATSLPRVSTEKDAASYKTADGLVQLSISHQYGRRVRHMVRLDQSKIAADPLLAGQSLPVGMSAYIVIDVPTVGYTTVEQKYIADALVAYLAASSGSVITKVLGGEN